MILSWVHGFLGLPSDWEPVVDNWTWNGIKHDFRNFWLDLGNLKSTGLDENSDWLQLLGSRIAAGIAGRKEPTVLIGYSLGGRLALHAAKDSRVWPYLKGLVLISTHPGLTDEKLKVERRRADRDWGNRFLTDPWNTTVEAWNAQPVLQRKGGLPTTPREETAFDRELLATALDVLSLGRQKTAFGHGELSLADHPFPKMLLTGGQDQKFTALGQQWAQDAAFGTGNLSHNVVASAGHRLPWDEPQETCKIISQFLSTL